MPSRGIALAGTGAELDRGAQSLSHQEGAGPIVVLVLDDQPDDQSTVIHKLTSSHSNRSVISVSTAEEALHCLGSEPVDCIVLDYDLLSENPEAFLASAVLKHPYIPVVVISGTGSEKRVASVLKIGAADYLSKSNVSEQAITRAMANAISKFRLKKSLDRERRQLVEANVTLVRQQREIQSFYHTVSHELKTPITAIREFNALILEGILGETNESQREALATSIGCCDRLNRLVNDLFDTARLETGKLRLNKETLDLNHLVKKELAIMAPGADHKSIRLSATLDEADALLEADPARIGQVVCNLVSNSIKYTPAGGKVEVRVCKLGDELQVIVEDNGHGISDEHTEYVFDRMYQCQEERLGTPTSQNGMGIGLFLCRQIIELHGGELSFRSESGVGSEFTFTLPIAS